MNDFLVTVGVLTYNSAATIVETLDSIAAQSFKNIELIVSDDASKDNTVEVVKEWILLNESRFVRVKLLTIIDNTGTSANCNRIVKAANGDYLKLMAGDDLLLNECIDDNLEFMRFNSEALVVFSNYDCFFQCDNNEKQIVVQSNFTDMFGFFEKQTSEQFHMLLGPNFLPAPTVFFNTRIFKDFLFDEQFKYIEDIPMWISLTQANIHLYGFNKKTVLYRIQDSISHPNKRYFSPIYYETSLNYFWSKRFELIKQNHHQKAYNDLRKIYLSYDLADFFFNNKRTLIHDFLMKVFVFVIKHFVNFKLDTHL